MHARLGGRMTELRRRAIALLLLAAGCAEGFPSASDEVSRAGEPPVATGAPDFMGEACPRGQRTDCTCPAGEPGFKLCTPDPKSPTMASFSGCLNCPEPAMNPTTPETAGMSAVGEGPDAQAGSSGRNSNAGRGAAGSGGRSGAGGTSSGAAGRMGTGRGTNTRCNCTESCFPVGVLACCRADNSCGCTWAPGAYCL
jgi:hypothetical protein